MMHVGMRNEDLKSREKNVDKVSEKNGGKEKKKKKRSLCTHCCENTYQTCFGFRLEHLNNATLFVTVKHSLNWRQ